jgi:uncharacterized membrane protein YkvA (DUF1232 family)
LVYVANPFDAIPDAIPFVGLMDAAALTVAMKSVASVILDFNDHLAKKGKKKYEIPKMEMQVDKEVIKQEVDK